MFADLSELDTINYDLSRAVSNIAKHGPLSPMARCLELEISSELERKSGQKSQGIMIPSEIVLRALTTQTTASGAAFVGYTVPTIARPLRNKLSMQQLGATVLSDQIENLELPSISAPEDGAYWIAEGSTITASSPTFDRSSLKPKTAAYRLNVSRRFLNSTTQQTNQWIIDQITSGLSFVIDKAAITGAGTDSPVGILNTAGINVTSIGTNGGAMTLAKVNEMQKLTAQARGFGTYQGWLMNGETQAHLRGVERVTGSGSFLYDALKDQAIEISQAIPSDLTKGSGTNLSAMVFSGAWENLVIALFGPIDLAVSAKGFYVHGGVTMTALQNVDIALINPAAFTVCSDIVTN